MDNGYKFISETDTEVIPNLISYYYASGNDFLKSVNLACNDLEGSYAIEVLCEAFPDKIIVAKKDSPLVIGTSKDSNYIASDIPAVLSYTKDFYLLEDGDIVEIYANKLNFYDKDLNPIKKKIEKIKNEVEVINDISQDEIERGKKVFEEFGIDYKKY